MSLFGDVFEGLFGGGGNSQSGGGGFFGSGASNTASETNSNQTNQSAQGGSAVSLSNIKLGLGSGGGGEGSGFNVTTSTTTTDHNAIESAFGFGENVTLAGVDFFDMAAGLGHDSILLASDVLDATGYLAELNAYQNLETIKANTALTTEALNAVSLANNNVSNIAYDAMTNVGHAYSQANQGLLYLAADHMTGLDNITSRSLDNITAIAADSNNRVASLVQDLFVVVDNAMGFLSGVQGDAIDQISEHSVASQAATMKALDYVFESTKSAEERSLQGATKWIMGGLVAVAAVAAFAR